MWVCPSTDISYLSQHPVVSTFIKPLCGAHVHVQLTLLRFIPDGRASWKPDPDISVEVLATAYHCLTSPYRCEVLSTISSWLQLVVASSDFSSF
jgi:hypothetical protein